MRNRFLVFAFAAAVPLGSSPAIFAQADGATAAKVHSANAHVDLSGVWRRSRRAPDQARKYTIYELAFAITNQLPPMTPWAREKYNANKPNVGPRSVSLTASTDPTMHSAPP